MSIVTVNLSKQIPSDHFVGETARRLNKIFFSFGRTIPVSEIVEALALGEPLLVAENARYAENLVKPLTEELHRGRTFVFDKAGRKGIKAVASPLVFDITNPRAVEFMRKFGAELVTAVTNETRAGIRAAMLDAFNKGEGGYTAARRIRGSIGLTRRQGLALQRYRRELEAEGLPSRVVDKRVGRYSKKLHKYRADRIARTELNRAANQGELEGWRQLADKRYIDRDRSKKCWMSFIDKRTSEYCITHDGYCVSLNETFPEGHDAPPAHPHCRSTIYLKPVKP